MKNRKSNFSVLLKKEIYYNYILSPLGLIFAIIFSSISVWLFMQDFFFIDQATLDPFFGLLPFLFLFFLPAITMNLFAEEKKSGTWEILLTLPNSEANTVWAKFLAAFIFTLASIIMTTPLVVALKFLGNPDWGVIISGYIGTFLLAGAYISLSMFFSSLTNNPIISLITSIVLLLINFFMGQANILSRLPNTAAKVISNLSLTFHFNGFINGNIGLSSIIFFLSFVLIFIWLTIVSLKSRNY